MRYSTGIAFAAFAKFNGKNYFSWRKMEAQLCALTQWEVVNGTTTAPVPVDAQHPSTADETRRLQGLRLRAARAYAEIAMIMEFITVPF